MTTSRVCVVSGFVPLPTNPRSVEEYHRLHEPLRRLAAKLEGTDVDWIEFEYVVEDCWLRRAIDGLPSPPMHQEADNSQKNTLDYHVVQHQKTEWVQFAERCGAGAETYVWLDYGILHQPGMSTELVESFLQRVRPDDFGIPGCWDRDRGLGDRWPCWRFCGSMFVIPRRYVGLFDLACKASVYRRLLHREKITWEVNTWAEVERTSGLPIRWYAADHDRSMFDNY